MTDKNFLDRSTRTSARWGPGRRLPVALSGSPEGWRACSGAAVTSAAAARRPPLVRRLASEGKPHARAGAQGSATSVSRSVSLAIHVPVCSFTRGGTEGGVDRDAAGMVQARVTARSGQVPVPYTAEVQDPGPGHESHNPLYRDLQLQAWLQAGLLVPARC